MDSIDFLEFAKKMDTTCEAGSRSCVSRSYYCTYHETKKFMEDKLNINVDGITNLGMHERVSKTLIDDKNPRLKGLGYKMQTLHSRRVTADYHLDKTCTAVSANEAITEAEKILKEVQRLST